MVDKTLINPVGIDAFYLGNQGSVQMYENRISDLKGQNAQNLEIDTGPFRLIKNERDPQILTAFVLAKILDDIDECSP